MADLRPRLVDMTGIRRQIPVNSRTTIYNLIDDGLLVAVKVAGRRFVTQESIDRYIDQLIAAATKPDNGEFEGTDRTLPRVVTGE